MSEMLIQERDSEDISLDDAQEISDRLENLREKKRERIKREIQNASNSEGLRSKCAKQGTVNKINHIERKRLPDKVIIGVEYVDGEGTEVESFEFEVPQKEKDIHIDNQLVRFINFVGDGSTVDLNKTMYRDVPLIIDEKGDVEIDIPNTGKLEQAKNILKRWSININHRLKSRGISMSAKYMSYGIISLLHAIVGFFTLQVSLNTGFVASEPIIEILILFAGSTIIASMPIMFIAVVMGSIVASTSASKHSADYTFEVSFSLLFLILGIYSITNGVVVGEGVGEFFELVKFSPGFVLPVLSLVYSYVFISKLNIVTNVKNKYKKMSKKRKLSKGPEYFE